jgi:hypothetical protein
MGALTLTEPSAADAFIAHLPELTLIIAGLLALLIVATYVRDRDSNKYKALTILGLLMGAIMVFFVVYKSSIPGVVPWGFGTTVVICIMAFALIIRPFREVHFAVILGLLVVALIYVLLPGLPEQLAFLSVGWPRIIVAFVVGGLAYAVFNFAEAIVKLVGKLLNLWPVLAVLAVLCIVEATCVYMGYPSLYDLLRAYLSA